MGRGSRMAMAAFQGLEMCSEDVIGHNAAEPCYRSPLGSKTERTNGTDLF